MYRTDRMTDGRQPANSQPLDVVGASSYYRRFGFMTRIVSAFATPYARDHFIGLARSGTMPTATGELRHIPAISAL